MDKISSNHALNNLAFLCFDHHDEYDSASSQRKNYTLAEVKSFRDELYSTINKAFSQQVHFGEISTPPSDPYAGSWIRLDSGPDSAEINLTPLPDSYEQDVQYFVSGLALWGADRPTGPNLGTIEFIGRLTAARQIIYSRGYNDEKTVTKLSFLIGGELQICETNWTLEYGANVTFEGRYQRAQ